MYSEDIPEAIKIQLVGVLEEKASILLTNPTSIEQTIGSLKNIYRQTDGKSWIFHSQLLVAMTAILLGLNQLAEQQQLVVDHINLLLELISKVNNGSDRLLRGTACECLREIETMHPGILMRKIEHLYSMIQLERTHVCQIYMALFVTVFKNAVVCVTTSRIRDNDAISDLLCHRKELLKPLNIPDDFTSNMFQLEPKSDFETALLPPSVNTSELKRASAFLMESLCLMTTPMQCYVLSHIMQYIATVPSLSSSTFKSHLLELSCTLDLSLFHVALQLKAVFRGDLINDADEEMLLRRLLLCTNHPSLTTAHRLLCSDWLRYFPENGNTRKVGTLPKNLMANRNLRALLPKVFDGLDTTLIKLSMLNECFTPSSTKDTSNGILMGCLQPLQKSIHYGITGRTAVTLFRSLFQYFRKHHDSYLKNEIFRGATGVLHIMHELGLAYNQNSLELTEKRDNKHLRTAAKAVFRGDLINDADEEMLLRRLLLCTNHPSLTTAHRLLCSDWLRYFPENSNTRKFGTLPKNLMANRNLRALLPKVFDGLDTTLIKLSMLNECFTPSSTKDTSNGILMGCLQPLQKSIHYGITGRTAVTLFRSLFQYFRKHHDSYLKNEIFSLLLSTVLKHPVFAPHTINFLHCVQEVVPQSTFPVDLLRATAEDILQLNPHVILKNLNNYLKLLERISAEKNINPKPTLGFVHQLLLSSDICAEGNWLFGNSILAVCNSCMHHHNTTDIFTGTPTLGFVHQLLLSSDICAEGNWLFGNSILAVCNSCMHHHNTTDIFTDVGNVLYVMLTEFNDIDVRDRARFYYAILTNLSTEKVSRVLSQANESSRSLSKLADSINIPSSSPVQKFKKQVLQLTRVSKEPPTLLTLPNPADFTLADYLDKIRDPEILASVTVNYKLHMDDDSELEEDIKDIYAIVLHLETTSNYQKMTDYQVPHLGRRDGRGVIVQLSFVPHYPIPTSFSVSALFSLSLSRTGTCKLADLHVKFEDLFLPLPVSPELRVLLFKKLWQDIRDVEQKSSTSLCTESVCVLQITMERMNVTVANDFADFTVTHYATGEQEKKWFVGIFLPPQSHLLLRIASNACNSVVSIATDNWKILALVNKYLHELENQ
ncbi:AP-5 complex subunit beta-1-like [Anneissia japonica]|uniref:AP-5 complex subunit beta-1-like n=1 Tax=Anneissia japonica TaxID=1529436 RepID=UPI00142598A2|nr:AP-5 complex subunit beta-1-like [Anneissia japonica]